MGTGTGTKRPRLGLLISILPKLTSSRTDGRASSEASRKAVPGLPPSASQGSSRDSPTATVTTTSTVTTRTSEDSRGSSGLKPSPLSPTEQDSPFSGDWFSGIPSSSSKKLQKAPAMPPSPPPPLPAAHTVLTESAAPPQRGRSGADRSPSPERRPSSRAKLQSNRLQPRQASPSPNARGRSVSAQPPTARGVSVDGPRAVSNPFDRRPSQPMDPSGGSPPGAAEKRKSRKSWFPGARARSSSRGGRKPSAVSAWLLSSESRIEYNTAPLISGDKVPELWNEAGNVYVYLHPKDSGRGPCFKVDDRILGSSAVLNELLVTEMMAAAPQRSEYLEVAPAGPVTEGHLYLSLGNTDLERLVAARNLFAFLTQQPLVGTTENPTLFATLLQIAGLLRRFHFSSYDDYSFGEVADTAFDIFVEHTGLADVRHSCEKTLEALILAEQMKSWNLYNEAFAHAVGKYEDLLDLKSPLYNRISAKTRKRLERAHLDLANRQVNVNSRLESFDFPSVFAGIASSTSTAEYKNVKFKEWKNSFNKMRSFVLGYYKNLFGSWPPRAKDKRNYFHQSGLNRQCLKILYSDLCALYDLLVDRQSLTPRVARGAKSKDEEAKERSHIDTSIAALRSVLSEFDKSSPPVLPAIPFDAPKIPSMTAIYENYNELPAKKQAKYSKALQPHELQLLMIKSRNIDTDGLQIPFLLAYKEFELREAKGLNPNDLADHRIGTWLFLYAVLQSLPMLVVDAPGLRHTEGVEYFLCEAPRGNPPWTEDAGAVRKMWYQTADQNIVELSADVVMFSVEGIYMRSHCWLAAKEWEATNGAASAPPLPPASDLLDTSALQPPRSVFVDMDPSSPTTKPQNPDHHHQRHQSAAALAPLPAPAPAPAPALGRSAPNSPLLRPDSGSLLGADDRARQALRASMAIGLEPLPLPSSADQRHYRRASRAVSGSGSGSGSVSGCSTPGAEGPVGGLGGGEVGHQLGGGLGVGAGLPASRSAVNLGSFGGGGGGGGWASEIQQPRASSYGGFPGGPHGPPGHGPSESLGGGGGGSTFDDILKGMDEKGKKTKKKLFF